MEQQQDKWVCAHCGHTADGRFGGDICPQCGLTYWKRQGEFADGRM